MLPSLNQNQRRVLGVLIEKSLAQPAYYPMTLNAIVAACNQKTARDPVLELDEDSVWNTLDELRKASLVTRLMPSGSSRTDRFKHETQAVFGWEKPQRAVLAELLLRGPQTTGELRQHCERMYAFENTESVLAVLDSLRQLTPPIVAVLPRGQSSDRYMHLLAPAGKQPELAPTPPSVSPPGPSDAAPAFPRLASESTAADVARPTSAPSGANASSPSGSADAQRIAALETALAALRNRVQQLEKRLEGL